MSEKTLRTVLFLVIVIQNKLSSMNWCSPNGNCLYNAVSILLKGNEPLATSLRLLTSVQLFEISEYYAIPPRMEEVLSSNGEQVQNQNNE